MARNYSQLLEFIERLHYGHLERPGQSKQITHKLLGHSANARLMQVPYFRKSVRVSLLNCTLCFLYTKYLFHNLFDESGLAF